MLPAAYHRDGWDGSDRPPLAGQRRFCDPDVETFLERVDELRGWAAAVDGVEVGVAAHSVRAVPASVARGDRRVRRASTASSATSTPTSSARELEECRGRARLLADRAARADRLPRAARRA